MIVKKKECEHEYKTITNLYGRVIREFIRNGVVYRSLLICEKCGKRNMSTEIDKTCEIKNQPLLWY